MKSYICKRLVHMLPTLLGITFLSFLIIQMAPGDFLSTMSLNPQIDQATIEQMRQAFGLDQNIFWQYVLWLKNLLILNLGYSFSYQVPVAHVLGSRVLNTLFLGASSMLLTWLLVIPLGLWSAYRKDKLDDHVLSFLSLAGLSVPVFFLAICVLSLVAPYPFFPLGGSQSVEAFAMGPWQQLLDRLRHLLLPALVLCLASTGGLFRVMRSHVIEQLKSQYVVALKARGLSERRILFVHVLRNSLNPLITILGFQLSALLSGAAFVEIIFSWPGMGKLMLEAVMAQDLYLIMGNLLMSSILLLVGNLLADVLLVVADPRIQVD